MPTKTNNSPVQANGLLAGLASKAIGLAGGAIKANPVGAVLTGAKGLIGGVGEVLRDRKEALAAGEEYKFGEGLKDFGAGALKGVTGIDLTDQDVYEDKTPTYTTNIDPMTGQEIPLTMTGKPLKMLTGVKGIIPHNMSAAQYKSGLKMQQISGAAPLQSNAFYASLNAAKEEGRDTFEVGGKTFNVK